MKLIYYKVANRNWGYDSFNIEVEDKYTNDLNTLREKLNEKHNTLYDIIICNIMDLSRPQHGRMDAV